MKKEDKSGIAKTCYAESNNGMHYKKPALNLVAFEGSMENEILFSIKSNSHNFCLFIDKNPEALSGQKNKALVGYEKNVNGLKTFISPDGIQICPFAYLYERC